MNKLLRLLVLSSLIFILNSCAVKIPLSDNYFNNQKKAGVIYVVDSINSYKEGSQGLLDMALTQGNRFKKPLQVVGEKVNPTDDIKKMYTTLFNSKGKSLKEIEFTEKEIEQLEKFKKPTSSDKKFYKYDLSILKEKEIDELLIVNVKYGLLISYYGVIEYGKVGYCDINSQIVNLSDNSIMYSAFSYDKEKINGKWKTPPEYENLTHAISKAIEGAIAIEKEKLDK